MHPDAAQGWGRVDVGESLFPTFPRKIYFNDTSSTVSLNTSESWDINYYVGSSSVPLKITLVWTDYPGSLIAAGELINNLDLVVTGPYDTYLGNGGSQPDTINNVEQVELLSPTTGWYTITVNGTNVPQGPQPFAIVMSGLFGNDSIAPSSISDLNALPSETWINWSWTNPSDPDFDHVELYLNGVLKLNSSSTYYNATPLTANTSYELSTRTVDIVGNINSSWINSSVNTTADTTAPSSITGLVGSPGETWINWSWTNPSDPDFDHVELYLNGVLKLNSSSTYYNATPLTANTSYELSTRTVDIVGNINVNWINSTVSNDITAPSSITGLVGSPGETWINWSWSNPYDPDFSHVEIYLDDIFKLNTSSTYYNATHLTANTSYELSTRTVDNVGNINFNWINSSTNTTADTTTPSSITGLSGSPGETWINWSWSNPSDPDLDHVELYLDGIFQTNTSSTSYNAGGLTADAVYELSTRTVDSVGNINSSWVNLSISTSATKSDDTSSGSSSSSGGGGGSTGEAFDNIVFKDVKTENIVGGLTISYLFDDGQNAIQYINFSALRNSGRVSTTIEVLKNKSAMVDESAPGIVYSNLNIWVGKSGFATADNIAGPVIGFSVPKDWLAEDGIDENSIVLYRHSEGKWNALDTEMIGEDGSYIYFEAETPGFSPFAIAADMDNGAVADDIGLIEEDSRFFVVSSTVNITEPSVEDLNETGFEEAADSEFEILFFVIPVVMVLILVLASYVARSKGL
ncbi:PGF-pre-PGF domain-containing protein [Methanococcoides orientis]|uniref:PGF-pre-PGF domain-containing protein n=1 Tax=Methanococcoides orientis TaxID=2822137 RepID=UPI001E2F0086|nr:PGF-pre-PGF domain-containing protein [Methanococcoides orientis]UGV41647.1 PGF-pre-PGF domain-containing protein [Methanococcoides orientis]